MSISFLDHLLIKASFNKHITRTFNIHAGNIQGIKYTQSNLNILLWFLSNVPNFLSTLFVLLLGLNINPEFHNTLGHIRTRMVQFSILNWFVLDGLPLRAEESVV